MNVSGVTQTCADCRFFGQVGKTAGQCLRYPPVPTVATSPALYPIVALTDWCGEYVGPLDNGLIKPMPIVPVPQEEM